jgi:hypothetical protein
LLAVASEAGSGKALAPVLQVFCERGARVRAFLSHGVLEFIRWAWPATRLEGSTVGLRDQSLEEVLGGVTPNVILVGTTARNSLERELIMHARHHGIPTLVVVDERYGFQRRFGEGPNRLEYLPDAVAVMDEECAELATAAGVPAERIYVTGSPILSFLAAHHVTLRERAPAPVHAIPPGRLLVTFISETFARDNGSAPGKPGLLGHFLGFTEESVRKDLIQVLRKIGRPVVLLERLHPSDTSELNEDQIDGALFWKQVRGGDLWPLLLRSDIVIGMKSMALLEAVLLGCRVASYQPNLIGENQCAAVRFRMAARLDTREELETWLASQLYAKDPQMPLPKDLPFIRADAAARVAELVLGLPRRP